MGKFKLWQKPHITNMVIGGEHRKVSWLELFFDIFFVCAIASVGHILVHDMSLNGFKNFAMTFIPVWWVWIGFMWYNEQFETFGLENRTFTFLMMIPIAGLAIYANHATSTTFIGFASAYVVSRIILGFLYGRAGYYIKEYRVTSMVYSICFSISIAFIILTLIYAPHPLRIYLFGVALFFDLLIPLIATIFDKTFQQVEPMALSEKINERFGLFSIIVIGELVVAVVAGISELEHPSTSEILLGINGLAIGLGMWWNYFDYVSRRGPDRKATKAFAWTYLHMPLVMSFTALSAGILYSISHPDYFSEASRILIGCSAGATMILIGLIECFSAFHKHEPINHFTSVTLKFSSGLLLVLIANFTAIGRSELMLVIFGFLAVSMIYGAWSWFKIPEDSPYETDYVG